MKLVRMAVDRPVTMYMFYIAVILLGGPDGERKRCFFR